MPLLGMSPVGLDRAKQADGLHILRILIISFQSFKPADNETDRYDGENITPQINGSEIDAEIERLRERRRQVLLKENERFARAAIKAGLAELDIPDDALDAAFEDMAARFAKAQPPLPVHPLKRLDQRIVHLEARRRRSMTSERKRDAREKIALGGLIVKAGLRDADRAFLLGLLLDAASFEPGTSAHRRLTAIGRKAFAADKADPGKADEANAAGTDPS